MKKNYGFTLLELLVVIAIIGILAAVVIGSTSDSKDKAKSAAAQQQLNQLRTGIFMLVNDTGKGPGGCSMGRVSGAEFNLNSRQAGLRLLPLAGVSVERCSWSVEEVATWNGPYFVNTIDPWGRSYYLDTDYFAWRNCPTKPEETVNYVLLSLGQDGAWYTCDDVFLEMN